MRYKCLKGDCPFEYRGDFRLGDECEWNGVVGTTRDGDFDNTLTCKFIQGIKYLLDNLEPIIEEI